MQDQSSSTPKLVAVRNLRSGPTVFKDEDRNLTVNWEGRDDPHGRDLQYLPDSYLQNFAFAKMVSSGVFDLDPALKAQVPHLNQSTYVPGGDLTEQVAGAMHRPEDKDLVAAPCIAPGTRPGASCSEQALTNSKGTTPPLCGAHANLAASCVVVDTPEGQRWTVATMGQRVTESQNIGPVPTA